MEERSLDEFVEADDEPGDDESGGSEDNASTDATDDASEQQSSEPPVDPSTVEPATPTSRYEPDGIPCQKCGEEVRRLWVDEERSVCRSCTSW
jgi:formylmethanofuran dehydrogenase subunit E